MPPPKIRGLRPISLLARTMPTESGRIGGDKYDSGLVACDRVDDRREVGGRRRVGLVVDDLEPVLLGVVAGAFQAFFGNSASAATRASVFGLGFCAIATLKKGSEKACLGSGPARQHREITRIMELAVDREPEQAEEQPVVLDRDRHRRRDHVGAVAPDRRCRPCRRRAAWCRCRAPSADWSGRRSRRA